MSRSNRSLGGPFRPWAILAVCLLVGTTSLAGMEWQLIDPGVPVATQAAHLFRMTGLATFLRIEDQFMVPQFWSLQGNAWVRRLESSYPEPFYKASFAYDLDRNVVVRFGGADKNLVVRAETWEFDGTSWVQRTDVGAPPGRIRAGMAYDTNRQVMVLFGGYDNNDQALNDTWEYDGVQWQLRNLSAKPPVRYDPIMSYDANRQRMVMAFGRSNTVAAFNDTWEFNGHKWSQPNIQNPPIARAFAASAYDPIRQAVYAYGGEASGQTIRWTGSSWDVVSVSSPPTARYFVTMTFDESRGTILIYGGGNGAEYFGDTWEFNGTDWAQVPSTPHQANRPVAEAAFDSGVGRGVMFGGDCCPADFTNDTAEWDGSQWSRVSALPNPGYLHSPAMTWSPSDQILLFGGFSLSLNDFTHRTWTYDTAADTWTELFPAMHPVARTTSMVYSPAHGGVVMFGGQLASSVPTNDTWLFRDGNWSDKSSPTRPQLRYDLGLAADTWRGNVVLYGGSYGNGLEDTWILTAGFSWQQIPVSGPGIRRYHRMTFDPIRGRSVLATGAGELDDSEQTWEFDGAGWSPVSTSYSPDMRRHTARLFWDSSRGVAVLSGGRPNGFSGTYSDTWAYGPDNDGDLRVGGYDNCPSITNANQLNADLDARGDACDCAPSDPGSWALPMTVQSLVASGISPTTISWQDQGAVIGPGVNYDVVTGSLAVLRSGGSFASATCLASHLGAPSASDSRLPSADDGYYYLARSRNACGIGTFERGGLDASGLCP